MTRVLITGMSGTGKSSVIAMLAARGYPVAETDDTGWCIPENGDWSTPDKEWVWDESRMAELLSRHVSAHLFVDGCRPNQGKFYDRFDHVVVLTTPIDVMLSRVANRTNNPFGQTAVDRDAIKRDKLAFEPLLIAGSDLVIDSSTTSPDAIADQLEALL